MRMILLFCENNLDNICNIDISTTSTFLNFRTSIRSFRHGLYSLPLTVNVEPFKNRAFKSNDVVLDDINRDREASTRSEGEKGKKDEAFKKGLRKGSEIGPFSGSRCES